MVLDRARLTFWGLLLMASGALALLGASLFPSLTADLGTPPFLLPLASLGLLVGGVVLLWRSSRVRIDQAPRIPAHVAFNSRTARPMEPPAPVVRPVARRVTDLGPRERELYLLEEEIRDLNRQINRAGVLLATGKLSGDGYKHYVEDLKVRRGTLEASRLRMELHRVEG